MSAATTKETPYAHFRHPDGSWYRLWITRSEPKTARGHQWHLHATYDKSGTIAPVAGLRWWDVPYGMANWNFDSEEEAQDAFRERAGQRLEHGYSLVEGALPTEPETADRAAIAA